jgi:hypothetical protein
MKKSAPFAKKAEPAVHDWHRSMPAGSLLSWSLPMSRKDGWMSQDYHLSLVKSDEITSAMVDEFRTSFHRIIFTVTDGGAKYVPFQEDAKFTGGVRLEWSGVPTETAAHVLKNLNVLFKSVGCPAIYLTPQKNSNLCVLEFWYMAGDKSDRSLEVLRDRLIVSQGGQVLANLTSATSPVLKAVALNTKSPASWDKTVASICQNLDAIPVYGESAPASRANPVPRAAIRSSASHDSVGELLAFKDVLVSAAATDRAAEHSKRFVSGFFSNKNIFCALPDEFACTAAELACSSELDDDLINKTSINEKALLGSAMAPNWADLSGAAFGLSTCLQEFSKTLPDGKKGARSSGAALIGLLEALLTYPEFTATAARNFAHLLHLHAGLANSLTPCASKPQDIANFFSLLAIVDRGFKAKEDYIDLRYTFPLTYGHIGDALEKLQLRPEKEKASMKWLHNEQKVMEKHDEFLESAVFKNFSMLRDELSKIDWSGLGHELFTTASSSAPQSHRDMVFQCLCLNQKA